MRNKRAKRIRLYSKFVPVEMEETEYYWHKNPPTLANQKPTYSLRLKYCRRRVYKAFKQEVKAFKP